VKVIVTARHAKFSDRMKQAAHEKAQHLEHYFDHLRKLEVILDADGATRVSAEMIASAVRGQVLVSHATGRTAMAALDLVVDKMERQLVKLKEKLQVKHTPHAGARPGKFNGGRSRPVAGTGAGGLWW
jgi:putative sigma-54 modulation protein